MQEGLLPDVSRPVGARPLSQHRDELPVDAVPLGQLLEEDGEEAPAPRGSRRRRAPSARVSSSPEAGTVK